MDGFGWPQVDANFLGSNELFKSYSHLALVFLFRYLGIFIKMSLMLSIPLRELLMVPYSHVLVVLTPVGLQTGALQRDHNYTIIVQENRLWPL